MVARRRQGVAVGAGLLAELGELLALAAAHVGDVAWAVLLENARLERGRGYFYRLPTETFDRRFSAVPKQNFASQYSCYSICRDPQD